MKVLRKLWMIAHSPSPIDCLLPVDPLMLVYTHKACLHFLHPSVRRSTLQQACSRESTNYMTTMAGAENDAGAAFDTLLRVADKLDAADPELYFDRDGHIRIRKRVSPSSSFFGAALHAIFTYIIGIVVVTYLLVQATETISFILSLNTGIVLKGAGLVFISLCGIFVVIIIAAHMEDNAGPANFPRWMLEAFN
jgi:hypothetical protein